MGKRESIWIFMTTISYQFSQIRLQSGKLNPIGKDAVIDRTYILVREEVIKLPEMMKQFRLSECALE